MLQSQVEQLQANLASVVRYVSERSRHSSSSQGATPPPPLPSSMTMSLPPSLALPPPVTASRSCDSLAQVGRAIFLCTVEILKAANFYIRRRIVMS